jgi:DedD protein
VSEGRGHSGDEREHPGPGWLATLLGGFVLVVLGFGLGVVVGAAREEPELVLRHLSSDAQEVPAPAPGPPHAAPPAPEAPPTVAPAPAPAPTPASEPAREAAPPVRPSAAVSSPPPAGATHPERAPAGTPAGPRYAVQVGAFAESAQAEKLAERLRRKGLEVHVTPGTGPRDSRWRVRVGPVDSRLEADRVAERLKTTEQLPTWVLTELP